MDSVLNRIRWILVTVASIMPFRLGPAGLLGVKHLPTNRRVAEDKAGLKTPLLRASTLDQASDFGFGLDSDFAGFDSFFLDSLLLVLSPVFLSAAAAFL